MTIPRKTAQTLSSRFLLVAIAAAFAALAAFTSPTGAKTVNATADCSTCAPLPGGALLCPLPSKGNSQ